MSTPVGDRLARRHQGQVAAAAAAARLLAAQRLSGVEALDLAGDAHGQAGGVEALDDVDAAAAFAGPLPRGVAVVAQRADRAHAGDHHADPAVALCHVLVLCAQGGGRAL
jgi:hypothetical protein